ncbi:MAG: YbfB/YjiJ family MFS transporter [Pseudomonadota bacterium]
MTVSRNWWIVLGLALGVTVSNAFARFAYGLILPAMQTDLGWSYTQSGWINTANALGYIGGALLAFAIIGRVSERRMFAAGLLVTSTSLLMCGLSDGFWYLTFWRFFAGVSGAPVFIAGGAMAATLFPDDARKNAVAIAGYFGGAGLGMVLSGGLLPGLFHLHGPALWPLVWIGLGVISLGLAPVSIWAASQAHVSSHMVDCKARLPTREMLFELLSYVLFATGYIVYLTFVIAWAQSIGLNVAAISLGWVLIGLGIIFSPFAWRPILAQNASGLPLAMACAITGLATLGPVMMPDALGFVLSSFLFGLAVFVGPAAVTAFSRKNLPEPQWRKAVSLFTLVFAVGQTIGPVAAGLIGDATGTLSSGIVAAGIILLGACLLASFQKPLAGKVAR